MACSKVYKTSHASIKLILTPAIKYLQLRHICKYIMPMIMSAFNFTYPFKILNILIFFCRQDILHYYIATHINIIAA